jgi:hypothetical protein
LPNHSLALEYQGETHYYSSHVFGKATDRQRADRIKYNIATHLGITVIYIPFWWDKSPSSLAATIKLYRPDIEIFNVLGGSPIPKEMPSTAKVPFTYTPNTSKEYANQIDPTGWYATALM